MNKKAKVFSLIGISGAMLFSFAIIGKNFDFLGVRALNDNIVVDSDIIFDGSVSEKITTSSPYIFRSTTERNESIYVATDTSVALKSGSIGSFRSTFDGTKDSVINFYSCYDDEYDDYVFQRVKILTIESSNAIDSIGVYLREQDETNYQKVGTMSVLDTAASGNKIGYFDFSKATNFRDSSIRLVQESINGFAAQIKKITLSYHCETNYVPAVKHEISTSVIGSGSIVVDTTKKYRTGDEVRFNVAPDSGYYASSVTTSNPDTVPVDHTTYYSFTMPDEDVEIRVTFEPIPVVLYNVYIGDSEHGTVNLSEPQTQYTAGSTVSFTIDSIDDGYRVVKATLGDEQEISQVGGVYSFTMPGEDVTINVEYELSTYSLSLDCGEHGTVSNFPTGSFAKNTLIEFDVSAETDYVIDKVTYNGTEITGNNGHYSFRMPEETTIVRVTFKQNQPACPYIGEYSAYYSLADQTFTIVIEDANSGYQTDGTKKIHFTITNATESSLTFIQNAQSGDDSSITSSNYCIFWGGTTKDASFGANYSNISFKNSVYTRTFTKQ